MNWQPLRAVNTSPIEEQRRKASQLAAPAADVHELMAGDSILPDGTANQILQSVWSDHLSLVKESLTKDYRGGSSGDGHVRENELKKNKEKIVQACAISFAEKTLDLERETEESCQALDKRLLRMQSMLPSLQSVLSQYKGKYAAACNMLVHAKKDALKANTQAIEELKAKYLTRERILKRIIEGKDEEITEMEEVVKSVVVKVQSLFDTFSDEVGYLNEVKVKLEEIADVLPKAKLKLKGNEERRE
jgi:hypothetical protein